MFILTIVILSGCVKRNEIVFNSASKVNIESDGLASNRVSCKINITNNSRHIYTLDALRLWVVRGDQKLAFISNYKPLSIAPQTTDTLPLELKIKISSKVNPLEILAIASNAKELYIEGEIDVKRGAAKRTLRVKRMSVEDFLHQIL